MYIQENSSTFLFSICLFVAVAAASGGVAAKQKHQQQL